MELKLTNLPCTLSELQSAIQSYCNCFSNWNVTLKCVRGKYISIDVPRSEKLKVGNSTDDVSSIALDSSRMLMSVGYRLLHVADELRELRQPHPTR